MTRISRQIMLHIQGNIQKKLLGLALTVGGRILQIPYLCTRGASRVRKPIVSANSSAVGSTTGASCGGWNILDVISLPASLASCPKVSITNATQVGHINAVDWVVHSFICMTTVTGHATIATERAQ